MLQFRSQDLGDKVLIQISGDLDESAQFPKVASISHKKNLVIDLEELGHINSAGIRLWLSWVEDLEALPQSPTIAIEKCPVLFVYQLNILSNFIPKSARIGSFFVSLFRESDESEKELLVTPSKQKYSSSDEITREIMAQSDAFKNGYELDINADAYFKFLMK